MRYLWDLYPAYRNEFTESAWKRVLMAPVANYLRLWDYSTAARVDEFLHVAGVSGFDVLPRQPGRWPKLVHKETGVRVDILPEGARPGTASHAKPPETYGLSERDPKAVHANSDISAFQFADDDRDQRGASSAKQFRR